MRKLINPVVLPYYPKSGELQSLTHQVQATHTTMGLCRFCYENLKDADDACGFIKEFGVLPPSPMEAQRRDELELSASKLNGGV